MSINSFETCDFVVIDVKALELDNSTWSFYEDEATLQEKKVGRTGTTINGVFAWVMSTFGNNSKVQSKKTQLECRFETC